MMVLIYMWYIARRVVFSYYVNIQCDVLLKKLSCEHRNVKINDNETQTVCFCRGYGPFGPHVTLNRQNIPFVN